MTGNQLIAASMRLIGALPSGEVPTADEAQDCLSAMKAMLQSWDTDRLMVFDVARLGPYNWTIGSATITFGTGGQINFPRPVKISRWGVIQLQNPAQPLELPLDDLTDDQWAAIPVKNIQSTVFTKIWDDGGFPLRTLNVWPVPTTQVQLVPYAWSKLSSFDDLTTDVEFPEGYDAAIKYNLAIDIAPEFGATITPEVALRAVEYKAAIQSLNAPLLDLRCDPAVVSPDGGMAYDWRTDGPVSR